MVKNEDFYHKVYDILINLGNAIPSMRETFIYAHLHKKHPTTEWRFQGYLGFGGKYRSETNTVDCYREDETPKRLTLIEKMNKELEKLTEKEILYVDMDGVVADFDAEIKKYHPFIYDHPDQEYRSQVIDNIAEANERIFLHLEPIEGALDAIAKLKEHYEIYFLSTPMWNVPYSLMDKRIWLEKHFGDFAKKRLILTHRKDLNIGAYLIDDRLKNGADKFTGKHIHFGSKEYPDWNGILKFLLKY